MTCRKFIDYSIASVFGGWLVATLLSQHPDPNFDRIRKLDNRFGNSIIPNWKFFAPNPAVEDVHILYRFANDDKTEHSMWEECHTISPRKWYQAFWFPRRRFEKGVFDAHQTIVVGKGNLANGNIDNLALHKAVDDTTEMLHNYIRSVSNPSEEWRWQQMLLVRFAGNIDDAQPIYDLITDYVPIRTGN